MDIRKVTFEKLKYRKLCNSQFNCCLKKVKYKYIAYFSELLKYQQKIMWCSFLDLYLNRIIEKENNKILTAVEFVFSFVYAVLISICVTRTSLETESFFFVVIFNQRTYHKFVLGARRSRLYNVMHIL